MAADRALSLLRQWAADQRSPQLVLETRATPDGVTNLLGGPAPAVSQLLWSACLSSGHGEVARDFFLGATARAGSGWLAVVVGGGTPFLPPVTEDIRLDLVETRTFGSRVITSATTRPR